jgi:signal peptidase I, bacterial type
MKNDKNVKIRRQVDRLGRPSIEMLSREIERLERKESFKRLFLDFFGNLITMSAVVVLLSNLWVTILQIDGSSMNRIVQKDDIVITMKYDNPTVGDIIAFRQNDNLYIKRIIALANDEVMIDKNGVVSVNSTILDEPYVTELSLGNGDIEFPYTVPPESIFVLGDDRDMSLDSRDSRFGSIAVNQIVGKVTFTMWPLSRVGKVS